MLFQPEAHEALTDEPWSADRVRTAIASIVADVESAFDDGWPLHPQDEESEDDAGARFRTVYPRHSGERIRIPGAARVHGRRPVAHARAGLRDARCGSGGAQPVEPWTRPLLALGGRPRHSPVPRRLRRGWRGAPHPVRRSSPTGRKVESGSGGGVQLPTIGYAFELMLAPLLESES